MNGQETERASFPGTPFLNNPRLTLCASYDFSANKYVQQALIDIAQFNYILGDTRIDQTSGLSKLTFD